MAAASMLNKDGADEEEQQRPGLPRDRNHHPNIQSEKRAGGRGAAGGTGGGGGRTFNPLTQTSKYLFLSFGLNWGSKTEISNKASNLKDKGVVTPQIDRDRSQTRTSCSCSSIHHPTNSESLETEAGGLFRGSHFYMFNINKSATNLLRLRSTPPSGSAGLTPPWLHAVRLTLRCWATPRASPRHAACFMADSKTF